VRNAIQAGAASVTLRTRIEHGARLHGAEHAWALRVEIVDDGEGVAGELAEHLFLPLVSGRAEGMRPGPDGWPSRWRANIAAVLTYRSSPRPFRIHPDAAAAGGEAWH
jgi:two-component system nitrogen regulation sensor histidine kinase GlnL